MSLAQQSRRAAPNYVDPLLGRKQTAALRRLLSQRAGGRPFVERTTGRRFDTIGEAVEKLGVTPSRVSDVLHGKFAATKGFFFEYEVSSSKS